jgi:hypothetical protein
MGLSEVVSHSGTTSLAQVGFVISFVVFALIVIWALFRPASVMRAIAQAPLHDGLSDEQNKQERTQHDGHE